MHKILSIVFVAAAVSGYTSFGAEIPSCKNKQNIVASGLVGTWTLDAALTEKLHGGAGPVGTAEATITEDDSVRTLFSLLGGMDKCSYLSGKMTLKWTENGTEKSLNSPFVLTANAGNPTIWYDERGFTGTFIKDLHRNFLMLAKGKTPDRDILFWGGDNNNQPLTAFVRK